MLTLKALTSYSLKVSLLLCDEASSNLTLLKLLSEHPRTQFPSIPYAETLRECYFVDVSLILRTHPATLFSHQVMF